MPLLTHILYYSLVAGISGQSVGVTPCP